MDRKRAWRGRCLGQAIEGYLFISPWIVGFLLFTAGPIAASLVLSFFQWSLIRPPRLVWFDNYVQMFSQDPLFWQSLKVTLTYVAAAVPLQLAFALFLAILLNQKVRLIPVFRTIFYMPSQVSAVAVAVIFLWIYHPELGLINDLLAKVGIKGPAWLISERWALPALIGMSLWSVGPQMIIFLAGLQTIPNELYEAAAIDGANSWQVFKNVTWPLLTPSVNTNLLLNII